MWPCGGRRRRPAAPGPVLWVPGRVGERSPGGDPHQCTEAARADVDGQLLEPLLGFRVEPERDRITHQDAAYARLAHHRTFFRSPGNMASNSSHHRLGPRGGLNVVSIRSRTVQLSVLVILPSYRSNSAAMTVGSSRERKCPASGIWTNSGWAAHGCSRRGRTPWTNRVPRRPDSREPSPVDTRIWQRPDSAERRTRHGPPRHNRAASPPRGARPGSRSSDGARLESLYPLSISTTGQPLSITCTSNDDQIVFGITGCRRTVRDLHPILDQLDAELDLLETAVGL